MPVNVGLSYASETPNHDSNHDCIPYQPVCMSKFFISAKSYSLDCGYESSYTRSTIDYYEADSAAQCACTCDKVGCIKFQYRSNLCRMKTLTWLDSDREGDDNTVLDPPQVSGFDRRLDGLRSVVF